MTNTTNITSMTSDIRLRGRLAVALAALVVLAGACTQSAKQEKSTSQKGTQLGGASGGLDGTGSSTYSSSSTDSSTATDDDDDDDDDKKDDDAKDDETSDDDDDTGSGAFYTRVTTKVVTDVTGTQQNTHLAGGSPCPDSYTKVGVVADCGLGVCNGDQAICIKRERLKDVSDDRKVVSRLSLSTLDKHGAPSCPSGQDAAVAIADCGGGACNGIQVLCKEMVEVSTLESGDKLVLNVAITDQGRHRTGSCDEDGGYASFGGVEDCGDARCEGIQAFCQRRKKP